MSLRDHRLRRPELRVRQRRPDRRTVGPMNRRVGLPVVIVIFVAVIVGLVLLTPVLQGDDDAPETAKETPVAAACTPVADPFGSPPDGFTYEKVDEETRAEDDRRAAAGRGRRGHARGAPRPAHARHARERAEQGLPRRTWTSSSRPPRSARRSRARQGFALIPLESGTVVAVGVRGCTAVLISAQDPNAVRFLATAVFVESSPR